MRKQRLVKQYVEFVGSPSYGEPGRTVDPAWAAAHSIIDRDPTAACQFAADAMSWAMESAEEHTARVAIDYVEEILIVHGERAIGQLVALADDDRVRVVLCSLLVPQALSSEWRTRLNCKRRQSPREAPSA